MELAALSDFNLVAAHGGFTRTAAHQRAAAVRPCPMGRIAARFTEAYPEVRLEIIAEDRYVDLVEEGYDIAIRVNQTPMINWWEVLFCAIGCCWWPRRHSPVRCTEIFSESGHVTLANPLELLGQELGGGPSMRQYTEPNTDVI